jgi:hypothetical protein
MKHKKSVQPSRALLLGIISTCLVAVAIGFSIGLKNSAHLKKTDTKIDPINQINFVLPEGWKQEDEREEDYLSFVSADYRANPIPAIENGANIKVVRSLKRANTSLREYVASTIPVPLENNTVISEKTIGGIKMLNMFLCWEGCFDSYYLENDAHVWEIHFSCAPGCSSQIEVEKSKYLTDRNVFLNSFEFE